MNMIDVIKYRLHYIRWFNIVVFYYPFLSGNVLDSCYGRLISNDKIDVDFCLSKK